MRAYIPKIGDKLKLIAPWKFPLYPETENKDLGLLQKLIPIKNIWAKRENLSEITSIRCHYPPDKDFYTNNVFNQKEYIEASKAAKELYFTEIEKYGVKTVEIEIPKNSVLVVNKINVKKEGYYYNSVRLSTDSFKDLLKNNRKIIHFSVKLEDYNKIDFEKL